jgi:hypothetical protein
MSSMTSDPNPPFSSPVTRTDTSSEQQYGGPLPPKRRPKMPRSAPTSPSLTRADAIEIWKRRRLGEAIHSIAAGFRVNPGRVAEVLKGKRFPEAEALSLI